MNGRFVNFGCPLYFPPMEVAELPTTVLEFSLHPTLKDNPIREEPRGGAAGEQGWVGGWRAGAAPYEASGAVIEPGASLTNLAQLRGPALHDFRAGPEASAGTNQN